MTFHFDEALFLTVRVSWTEQLVCFLANITLQFLFLHCVNLLRVYLGELFGAVTNLSVVETVFGFVLDKTFLVDAFLANFTAIILSQRVAEPDVVLIGGVGQIFVKDLMLLDDSGVAALDLGDIFDIEFFRVILAINHIGIAFEEGLTHISFYRFIMVKLAVVVSFNGSVYESDVEILNHAVFGVVFDL